MMMATCIRRCEALAWLAAAAAAIALSFDSSAGNPSVPLNYSGHEMLWPVTVDGKLDEWRDADTVLLAGESRWQGAHPGAAYGGLRDLAGRFRLGWDRNNLYLAVESYDDELEPPPDGEGMLAGDCVVIAVDAHNDASQGYDEDDSELGFAYTRAGPIAWRWFPDGRAGALTAARMAVVREEKPDAAKLGMPPIKVTYEIAIPWSELPAPKRQPAAGGGESTTPPTWSMGSAFGFDLALNDADAAPPGGDAHASAGSVGAARGSPPQQEPAPGSTSSGSRHGWLQWTPGIMGLKDPSRFGNVLLAGPAVTE